MDAERSEDPVLYVGDMSASFRIGLFDDDPGAGRLGGDSIVGLPTPDILPTDRLLSLEVSPLVALLLRLLSSSSLTPGIS